MSEVEKAAKAWGESLGFDLPNWIPVTGTNWGEAFLAGAAWQREQDAKLAEAKLHADYPWAFAKLIREQDKQEPKETK